MNEINLKYEVQLPNDGSHDQGISLRPTKNQIGEVQQNIVVNPSDKSFFQSIKTYSNGLVVSEEVRSDYRTIRFNVPYTVEDDVYYLEI